MAARQDRTSDDCTGHDNDHGHSDQVELLSGLRLAAIALLSAVVTATVVISVGGTWMERSGLQPSGLERSHRGSAAEARTPVRLIRTSG